MRGRNGRVFEGGSCESLIPRFHQRVQIWRLLLLSSPVLKTRHGPGRKLEDRIGKGRAGEGKSDQWEKVEGRQLKKKGKNKTAETRQINYKNR